jgi:hypothetical protein
VQTLRYLCFERASLRLISRGKVQQPIALQPNYHLRILQNLRGSIQETDLALAVGLSEDFFVSFAVNGYAEACSFMSFIDR